MKKLLMSMLFIVTNSIGYEGRWAANPQPDQPYGAGSVLFSGKQYDSSKKYASSEPVAYTAPKPLNEPQKKQFIEQAKNLASLGQNIQEFLRENNLAKAKSYNNILRGELGKLQKQLNDIKNVDAEWAAAEEKELQGWWAFSRQVDTAIVKKQQEQKKKKK